MFGRSFPWVLSSLILVGPLLLNAGCAQNVASIRVPNPIARTAQEKCGLLADHVVSRDDALCIAKVSGLERGVTKWHIREYDDYVDVFNTTSHDPVDRGTNVRVHRVGGKVLTIEPWEAIIVR
jgi:hypothetical protein